MKEIINKLIIYFTSNSRDKVIEDISLYIEESQDIINSNQSTTKDKVELFVEKYCSAHKGGTKCEE